MRPGVKRKHKQFITAHNPKCLMMNLMCSKAQNKLQEVKLGEKEQQFIALINFNSPLAVVLLIVRTD